jgi:hypothetical protein
VNASLETPPSPELLTRTHDLIRRGNAVEAELLAHLGEVDARRLYLEQAFPSMFVFCVRVLHFSEAVAYKRICAARTARRHPEILAAVREGELHVTAVSLLAPQLTRESGAELIRAARHETSDEIRRLLADRLPKADVPASMRRIPGSRASVSTPTVESTEAAGSRGSSGAGSSRSDESVEPARLASARTERSECGPAETGALSRPAASHESWRERGRSEPLGAERYCVRFTADAALHAQLQELQVLMRHQIPDGDLGKILARAVPLLLEQVRKRKFGECSAARPSKPPCESASRSIPAATRRTVRQRDSEGCTYVSPDGRRCGSREFLEFHHRDPWARMKVHSSEGITLFCRAHNQHQARRDFGDTHRARYGKRSAAQGSDGSEQARSVRTENSSQLDLDPVGPVRAGPEPPSMLIPATRSSGTRDGPGSRCSVSAPANERKARCEALPNA